MYDEGILPIDKTNIFDCRDAFATEKMAMAIYIWYLKGFPFGPQNSV